MYKEIGSNKRRTALLIFFFLVFVIGLGYLLSYVFNNQLILIIAVVWAIAQVLISYYYSDSITLAISGAKEVPRKEPYLDLHRVVENLSIVSGLPKPRVYVINDSAPNAFATGRDPKHASIAVTSGLLDKLNKTELEGVIAHELSHVGNYDIRLMTIVVVLVGVVALLSDFFLRWTWFGGMRRRDSDSGQLGIILLIVAIALAILAPIAATLIQLAISRKREFLADASGALLTRYPEGLAEALGKIAKDREPLEVANKATAHLYIASPFKNKDDQGGRGWFAGLFDTHPPIEDRIRRLHAMISK